MSDKLYTKVELEKKSLAALIKLAEENGYEYEADEKPTKVAVIKELLTLEVPDEDDEELDDDELEADDEADDEVDDDEELDDEELDDEEEVDEPAPAKKPAAKAAATKKPAAKKAATKAADGEETLAAKQVAMLLGTEAKTLRQFFRSPASTIEAVGSGGRYEFLKTDIDTIKAEFEAWRGAHAARGSKRGAKGSSTPAAVQAIEEVEDIEELDDDEEIDDEELELDD